jgi:diaminohydroxyphosphoribosylaminopyrimidine deaminase/5-amino-6-(5-phosphoribosylamino)uracil reductase
MLEKNMSEKIIPERIIPDKEMYMQKAIDIAKTAVGYTSPNPMVGCVVVKNGRIISEACHERYGEYHAERNALLRCTEDTIGAELYVTLEPCCHYGKTPPCTDIIIEKGIKKVYIGSLDSNPLVAGKGVEILKNNGIEVESGILEEECIKMNEIFYHYIVNKTPFVAAKYAMTIDGKIATYTGDSKWVTGEKAREYVQVLRKKYSGIMVGINTVIEDNPMLNCRLEENKDGTLNPIRIILDSNLRIPLESNIVKTAKDIRTIVAYSKYGLCENNIKKKKQLEDSGIELIATDGDDGKVDLESLMKILGNMGIDSILLEGGSTVNSASFEKGIVDKVYAFIAPKLIMGEDAKSPVSGKGIELMKNAIDLKNVSVENIGNDILIKGYLFKNFMA